jgi:AraC family transcriptional regulator
MNTPDSPRQPDRIAAQRMPNFLPSKHQTLGQRSSADVQMQIYRHRSTTRTLIIPAVAEPLLVMVLSGGAIVEERVKGQAWSATTVCTDDFFLTMSPQPYEMRWQTTGDEDFEVAHLYLSQRLLELAAQEVLVGRPQSLRLQDVSGGRDAQVAQLMTLLHQEMAVRQLTSNLYLHGIAQALAVHLVRHYRDENPELKHANALPAYKLHGAIEQMRAGLERNFSLATLAAGAGMSDFHFSRLFRRATGQSPSQYFIQMRMDKARELLLESNLSVIEVALEVGYSSPSHFSQVFRRHTGATPREYRQS